MTDFIPLFPLSVVLYPGEESNLFFEPKYILLIKECYEQKMAIGILVVINSKLLIKNQAV